MTDTGNYRFINCQSGVAVGVSPLFTLSTGVIAAEFRRWSGGISFAGISADDVISVGGEIEIIDLGSPSGGLVEIYGTYEAIINPGSATVNISGAILGGDVNTILNNQPSNFSLLAISGTGVANSNVSEIAGDATAATNLKSSTETMITGLTTGIPTTTNIPTNLTETVDNQFGGRVFILRTGTFARQAVEITAYNGTTKTLTVNALTGAPAASDAFVIV